jgi:hypothetical protein
VYVQVCKQQDPKGAVGEELDRPRRRGRTTRRVSEELVAGQDPVDLNARVGS